LTEFAEDGGDFARPPDGFGSDWRKSLEKDYE
jgi:hypothetical protein